MTASTFEAALARVLAHEGGYSDHPSDPGGPTNFGITLAVYRQYAKPGASAADVRAMTRNEAAAIYRARYWDALRCDDLPAGVDYAVFDYGVNSGVGRGGKVLRRMLALPDTPGTVTEPVLQAARRADPRALVAAICDERLAFLRSLKTWPVFGNGWSRRVADVRRDALAMAASSQKVMPAAPRPSALRAGAATAAVVTATAVAQRAHAAGTPLGFIAAIAAAAVLAVAAWLVWRQRQSREVS